MRVLLALIATLALLACAPTNSSLDRGHFEIRDLGGEGTCVLMVNTAGEAIAKDCVRAPSEPAVRLNLERVAAMCKASPACVQMVTQ